MLQKAQVLLLVVLGVPALARSQAVPQNRDTLWSRCASGDPDLAVDACTAIIASGTETTANLAKAFKHRAQAYELTVDWDRAIQDYGQVIRLTPDDAFAFDHRGVLYGNAKGDYTRSLLDLDQAIRLDPRGADAFADRGAIYMFKGDYARALQDYDQALRLNPNDVFVSFRFESRGWLRFYLGQFAGAGDDFRKALDLDPKNAGAAIAAYLAQSRAGTPGQSDLRQRALTLDLQKWPGAVVRLYLDSTSADSVLPAAHNADAATDRRLQCEAYFYLGEDALLHGRRAEAVRLLQAAIKTGEATAASSSACAAAQTELNRLSVSQPGSR